MDLGVQIRDSVRSGNAEALKLLLDQLSQEEAISLLQERDMYGKNILFEAASDSGEILHLLLSKLGDSAEEAILAQEHQHGWTSVHVAVFKGNAKAVQMFLKALKKEQLKNFIDGKYGPRKETPLHSAITETSNVEVMKAILASMASKEDQMEAIKAARNVKGETLFHTTAARFEKKEVFTLLAEAVRDDVVRAELYNVKDTSGRSVLDMAIEFGNLNVFKRVCQDLELGDNAINFDILQEMIDDKFLELSTREFLVDEWVLDKVSLLLANLGPDKFLDLVCKRHVHYGETIIHVAAGLKKEGFLRVLLERQQVLAASYAILLKDSRDRTALFYAAESGTMQSLKLLMEMINSDPETVILDCDVNGYTLLHLAAADSSSSSVEKLEFLMGHFESKEKVHASIKQKAGGDTVLGVAVRYGNQPGVEYLLKTLGPLKAKELITCERDRYGRSFLHNAVSVGNLETIMMLIPALGLELSKQMLCEESEDHEAFAFMSYDDLGLLRLLMRLLGTEAFMDIMIGKESISGRTPFETFFEKKFRSDAFWEMVNCVQPETLKSCFSRKNKNGRLLLHTAATSPHIGIDVVKYVVDMSPKDCFQLQDDKGDTVLHLLKTGGKINDFLNLVHEAEERQRLFQLRNNKNETLFHRVLGLSDHERNEVLIQNVMKDLGLDEIKSILGGKSSNHKHRALHVACELGSAYMVKLLLDNGCEREIMRMDDLFLGNTTLHAAAISGNVDVFNLLLDALKKQELEVEIDCTNWYGQTPLHELEVKIDCTNWYGQTPLHFAMMSGNEGAVKYLIEKGADAYKCDHAGATACHFYQRSSFGYDRCVEDAHGFSSEMYCEVTQAGLTPLHYAAWSGGDIHSKLLQPDNLKAPDNVDSASSFLWLAKTNASGGDASYRLTEAYIENQINPFPSEDLEILFPADNEFVISPPNAVMRCMCGEMIEKVFPLTKVLVACTCVYGNAITNDRLAKRLNTELNTLNARADLLQESRAFELVAMCSSNDLERKEALLAFLKGMSADLLPKLQTQLELAFAAALEKTELHNEDFLQVLTTYMTNETTVRELLQAWLWKRYKCYSSLERHYESLDAVEKSRMKEIKYFVEDIPLAYWVAHLRVKQRMDDSDITSDNGQHSTQERPAEFGKAASYVEGLLKLINLDSEYPNTLGRYTGRTALHWAVKFGEVDVVRELTENQCLKKDTLDDFGKPAYWYVYGEHTQTHINRLKWEGYDERPYKDGNMYVDGLQAILVGAVLIATVAFTGVVTPPLQYPVANHTAGNSSDGSDIKFIAIQLPGVQIFWVSISMSFFFSVASTLACVTGILPKPGFDLKEVEHIRQLFFMAAAFLVVSIAFVLMAFGSVGFAVISPNSIKHQYSMIVTTSLGGLMCVYTLGKFGTAVYSLTSISSHLRKMIWWIRIMLSMMVWWISKCMSLMTRWIKSHQMEPLQESGNLPAPKRKRLAHKRGSIHESIIEVGGYSAGPYKWDDGLWEHPFAICKKENPSETVPPMVVVTQ